MATTVNNYAVGDPVHLPVTWSLNSVATDPTTVTLFLKGPTIGLLTLTWAGGGVIRDSAGNFHYDYTIPASGTYYYRWEATGTVVKAYEGSFTAGPSNFK